MDNIDTLRQQQQMLMQRLNSLSCDEPIMPNNDTYSLIEEASSKLTEQDKNDLLKDTEYQKMVSDLNLFIQSEIFRFIRSNLNNNQQAVALMKNIAEYINRFKADNDNKKNAMLEDFSKYIENYSDISYAEYLTKYKKYKE